MARSAYVVREDYLGADNLAEYTFDFKIENLSQLLVIEINNLGVETKRVRGTDTTYLSSVTFDPIKGGGKVTLAANLVLNYRLILLLANDEPTQTYGFKDKFDFTLARLEGALDLLMGPIQRLAYLAKRSVKIHDQDDVAAFDPTLPPKLSENPRATLIINPTGTGMAFGPTTTQLEQWTNDAASAASQATAAANASATSAAESQASAEASALSAAQASASADEAAASAAEATLAVGDLTVALAEGAVNQDVTGLLIDGATYKSAFIEYMVYRSSTTEEKLEAGCLVATYKPTAGTWTLTSTEISGELSGVDFTMTATGQVQYSSTALAGLTPASKLVYRLRRLSA